MNCFISYEKLKNEDKKDIDFLKKCCNNPEIEKFIKLSDSFFDFVTKTPNIYYYKIKIENEIVGGLHLQVSENVLYLSIWVLPSFQRKGIAEHVINDLKSDCFKLNYNEIESLTSEPLHEEAENKTGKGDDMNGDIKKQ